MTADEMRIKGPRHGIECPRRSEVPREVNAPCTCTLEAVRDLVDTVIALTCRNSRSPATSPDEGVDTRELRKVVQEFREEIREM